MQTGRMHKHRGMVDTVLKYLQAGNELTADKAIDLWREANVRNKISQLRSEGWNIGSREEPSKRGGKYKVYFLDRQHPRSVEDEDEKEHVAYWLAFFSSVGDKHLRQEMAEAMRNVYMETGKEYKEIWPEPGTSVFKPIYERYGYVWEAPKKASA